MKTISFFLIFCSLIFSCKSQTFSPLIESENIIINLLNSSNLNSDSCKILIEQCESLFFKEITMNLKEKINYFIINDSSKILYLNFDSHDYCFVFKSYLLALYYSEEFTKMNNSEIALKLLDVNYKTVDATFKKLYLASIISKLDITEINELLIKFENSDESLSEIFDNYLFILKDQAFYNFINTNLNRYRSTNKNIYKNICYKLIFRASNEENESKKIKDILEEELIYIKNNNLKIEDTFHQELNNFILKK